MAHDEHEEQGCQKYVVGSDFCAQPVSKQQAYELFLLTRSKHERVLNIRRGETCNLVPNSQSVVKETNPVSHQFTVVYIVHLLTKAKGHIQG